MTHTSVAPLERSVLPRDTAELARFLLGKVMVREMAAGAAMGRIVETEAYPPGDPAGHAFRGMTARNRSLFLDAGHSYVYLCYGTSYLLNVSSEGPGIGAGVLLRALEPLRGALLMQRARPAARPADLARGPGRLSAALCVDLRHDGLDLCAGGPLWLGDDGCTISAVGVSTRIGITKGASARLRFYVSGSAHLSGPRLLNACSD